MRAFDPESLTHEPWTVGNPLSRELSIELIDIREIPAVIARGLRARSLVGWGGWLVDAGHTTGRSAPTRSPRYAPRPHHREPLQGLDGAHEHGIGPPDRTDDDVEHRVYPVDQIDVGVPGVPEEDLRAGRAAVAETVGRGIVGPAVGLRLDDAADGGLAIDVAVQLAAEQMLRYLGNVGINERATRDERLHSTFAVRMSITPAEPSIPYFCEASSGGNSTRSRISSSGTNGST